MRASFLYPSPYSNLHLSSTSFLTDSELRWLGQMFSVSLLSWMNSSPGQVMAVVSCRSDWQWWHLKKRKMLLHIPALCLSGSSSSLIHAQLLTHKHTRTNIWAQRAIISPAVYFKRPCSPRKNTHYNLAVHKCRVAVLKVSECTEREGQTDRQRHNTHDSVLLSFIYFSLSVRLCSSKLAPCISCKLLHKDKNNSVCWNSWNGSVLTWRQTHLSHVLAAVL